MNTVIPEGYKSILGMYDTQKAISLIHRLFEDRLGADAVYGGLSAFYNLR